MNKLWLLGERKLNGLKLNPVLVGVRITETKKSITLSVMRRVVSWSASPRLLVSALFFSLDEGFFSPQKGQFVTEPEISLRQFGQRSEFLVVEVAISRLSKCRGLF
ncbi:hypothetical protein LA52FAK_04150 [Desulforhopalus sp. 52FAK]